MNAKQILGAAALAIVATSNARAATDLVVNGGFEQLDRGAVNHFIGDGPNNTEGATKLTGWYYVGLGNPGNANDAAIWVSAPGAADSIGGTRSDNFVPRLYGPANGHNNGLTAASPAGGNFLVADADSATPYSYPLSQTISGLTPGSVYNLSFYWAAAQWDCCTGATTEAWQVSFGSETQTTAIVNLPTAGFSGWIQQTFRFTAGSASQALTFLAQGGPGGLPPAVLLDGVSLTAAAVPEPANWAMLIAGFGLVGAVARRRRHLIAIA